MKKFAKDYVDVCNKLAEARKQIRDAHSVGFMIADIVSTVMIIGGILLMVYSAMEYALAFPDRAKELQKKIFIFEDNLKGKIFCIIHGEPRLIDKLRAENNGTTEE